MKTIEINGNEYQISDIVENLTPIDTEEKYNEMLDEVYGDVQVAGYSYSTSRALKELDPIAYNVGLSDWLGSNEDMVEVGGEWYWIHEIEKL